MHMQSSTVSVYKVCISQQQFLDYELMCVTIRFWGIRASVAGMRISHVTHNKSKNNNRAAMFKRYFPLPNDLFLDFRVYFIASSTSRVASAIYNYAEVTIRKAELSEVDTVKEIISEAYEPIRKQISATPHALREGLDKIARHIQMGNIYVAVIGNTIVGTMRVSLRGRVGVIARVAVRNKYRGRRIGTLLVEYAENMLQHMGATCIEVEVYGAIENQLNFYKKNNYVEIGRSISEGEQIVVMRKDLCEPVEEDDEDDDSTD